MSRKINVKPPAVCKRFELDKNDVLKIDTTTHAWMAFFLYLVRKFEARLLEFKGDDLLYGPIHSSIGQEAIAAALGPALGRKDMVGSSHRAHGHFLAKILTYYAPAGFSPLKEVMSPTMQDAVNRTLAEILGLAAGWCNGRGGSMHLYHAESGNLGCNGIVGGGIPLATGTAWAEKLRDRDTVVLSIFGDGAINQGCFHEAANLAALWNVPVIFFVENNQYAVATASKDASYVADSGLRSLGYGIDSLIINGMDPVEVYLALDEAVKKTRKKPFPFLIEAKTYRFHHHSGPLLGSSYKYRSKEEESIWSERDPVVVFPLDLISRGLLTVEELETLEARAEVSVNTAVDFCTDIKENRRYIPDSKWPTADTVETELRGEEDLFQDVAFVEREDFTDTKEITYVEAIAGVTLRNMEKDARVIVVGEEVANFGGGAYGATKGVPQTFPKRIFNTPISENGFVGLAAGAASAGLRPVIEIMFPDFSLVAADQLFNQMGKLRHMFNGEISFPVVLRTRFAVGAGYGGHHSMDPVGIFGLFAGWRIMGPSTPFDYVGLFNTAIRFNDPVLIIDDHRLYSQKGAVPVSQLDHFIRYGKAKVVREGSDLTVLSYLGMLQDCLAAAEEASNEGYSVEVIDLRTLDYMGMDYETIGRSIKKTNSVLIVEHSARSMGLASRVSDEIQERFFDYLDCPINKLTLPDVPPPVSRPVEKAIIPGVMEIKAKMIQGSRHHF